jgi:BirA family biotin operon repressor/biotin-[acetyl-CoA-carboxylase] ligase
VFAAAAAVATAVESALEAQTPIEIKWPNDVLVAGRKVSGINLPVQLRADGTIHAVLGIGVNVNTPASAFPADLQDVATSLRIARGAPVDRIVFAEDLLVHLEEGIDRLRSGGFEWVLDCWRKYFRMARSRVRIGGPGISREIEGVVEGIDAEGALRLRTRSGFERILAGDVTVLHREQSTPKEG